MTTQTQPTTPVVPVEAETDLTTRFGQIWLRITEPHPTATGYAARLQARLLATLSIISVLGAVGLLVMAVAIGGARTQIPLIIAGSIPVLLVIYALARSGGYRVGIGMLLGIYYGMALAATALLSYSASVVGLVLPILLTTIFLPVRYVVSLAIVSIAAGILFAVPNVTSPESFILFICLTLIFSAAVIMTAYVRRHAFHLLNGHQQALTESELRFRQLAASLPDIVVLFNVPGHRIDYLNRDEFLGYDRSQLTDVSMMIEAVHDDDRAKIIDEWTQMVNGDITTTDGEYRFRNQAGIWELLQLRQRVVAHDTSGKPSDVLVTCTPITTQRAAQQTIVSSQRLLTAIYDTVDVGICVLDAAGRFKQVNRAYCEITGYTADELMQRHFSMTVPPDMLDDVQTWLADHTGISPTTHTEWRVWHKTHTTIPVHMSMSRLHLHETNRAPERLTVVAVSSLMAQRQAEHELAASELRNQALLDVMPDRLFVQDETGTYLDVLTTEDDDLMATLGDLVGRNMHDVVATEDAELFQKQIDRVLETGDIAIFEGDYAYNDQIHNFEIRMVPYDQGKVLSFVRDITARKENDARQMELTIERERIKLLRQFVNDVSHDLMTPLTIIRTSLHLLSRTNRDEGSQERIRRIDAQVSQLERMINDMLMLSRLESNKDTFRFAWMELDALVNDIVKNHEALAQEKHQVLTFHVHARHPRTGRLRQINACAGQSGR